jgi:hypothetical protein
MTKLSIALIATAMLIAPAILCRPVLACEEEIYGTWKLVSEQMKILDTGEIIDRTAGAVPSGYVTFGKDGRMMVLSVRGVRPKPDSLATMTNQQRAALFTSMIAYGGTYKFDCSTMEAHVDISWNETWTGTTQIRDVKRDGDKLVFTTRPAPSPIDGRTSVSTVIWEKVK